MTAAATSLPADGAWHDLAAFTMEAQGHSLTFIPGGRERLQALLNLIAGAARSLRLCFYIFAADESGRRVRDAILEAAQRGVAVSLIVDSFGSNTTSDAFFEPIREAGGSFCWFSPRWGARYLIRNHQKIVIADEAWAVVGGFNVEDDYFGPPQEDGWTDLAVELRGPAVAGLVTWYDRLKAWTIDPHAQWRAIRRLLREWDPGSGPVRWVLGGPTRGLSTWARAVSLDLRWGKRLDMVMAYFAPSPRLLGRLGRIARKRQARLVLPQRSDNGATVGAARLLYGKLLRRGAQIWEFQPAKLHTKLIVIDDVVYIGSANFDMRSLYINLEIMLRIEDAALAARMREYVAQLLPASQPITRALHRQRRTLLNRIRWSLSWFLVSVVDYTVARRLNLGL